MRRRFECFLIQRKLCRDLPVFAVACLPDVPSPLFSGLPAPALFLQIPNIFLFLESKLLKKADSLKKQPKIGFMGKRKARKH